MISEADETQVAGIPECDRLITFLLCWFLGILGIHRFYAGHYKTGAIQLVTFGGLLIWVLYDAYLVLVGKFTDSSGRLIVNW